jgi:amino acid adenylation domain-containing protein
MKPDPRTMPTGGLAGPSLAGLFEQRVAGRPQAVALTLDADSLTYGELNARANRLAAHLRGRDVAADVLVGIHLDRSFDLIVAILATLKAGGAYLPLDLACPEDRLRFQVRDAGAKVVLTDSRLAGRFATDGAPVICLDRDAEIFANERPENFPVATRPSHLAYVIYTSGSTGQPKGVLVTQENVRRLFTVTDELFHFGPDDVWTLFHSSAFDFSVWEIFGALLYGGRLVIVPHAVSRSATDFHALLVRERVTVLNQTPAAFRQLVHADGLAAERPRDLRYVIFGGEALEFQSLRPWFDRYGDARPQLVNMYGITETTVHVTHHVVTRGELELPGSNIGRPLGDLVVYLVGEDGARVAPGEVGEMWVGGAGVARGYLNRPELTSERFVPNPFEPDIAPVLYRSGDLARERANGEFASGELDYLGRRDHQVKIRGFRIELHEIEAGLARHPAVRDCAVLARAEAGAEPRLVGYVIAKNGEAPTVEILRTHLAQSVPDYMVPAAFVFLDAFPLTINGKLDRAALPAPGADRPHLATLYAAPQNDLEAQLTRLWKSTLRRELVGTDDNFFDIGGDSLLLTALHRDLERELRRSVPITDLFQYPTIRALAAHLGTPGKSEMADRIAARAQRQRAVLARGRAS